METPGDTSGRARRWPLWVAVGLVGLLTVAAVVTTIGASQAEEAADDAEAEVVEARQANQTARADLREVRTDTRAARQDLRVHRGLVAPGMADTLQAAYLLLAAEVCVSDSPEAPEALQRAADTVSGQVPALAAHEGWEAAVDPARIAAGCTGG